MALALCFTLFPAFGQSVGVGSGSYTTTFPGVDAAGRNSFPSGTPYVTGEAATKPIPTNDWWSTQVKNPHADNLFSYPFSMRSVNEGLVITYIPWGVLDNILPITVGVSGLNASAANISDHSDWTVTMDWQNGSHHFQATAGIGMPFLYFEKAASDVAEITIAEGTATVSGEMLIVENARNGADFAIYAPTGSVWNQNGNTYTSTLNGQNYWSLAFIPLDAASVTAVANEYKSYAYVFPTETTVSWDYNESTSVLKTDFEVAVDVKEGTDSVILQGLLPHQWSHLASTSPVPAGYSYQHVRGEIKTLAENHFSVEKTFHGILPTLPYLGYYSTGFSPLEMSQKVTLLENDGLATWTDSYNEGQVMNRLIQTARIADQLGDTVALNKMLTTVKNRLEDWLTVEAGEVAFLFYYNSDWTAMIGYPAGHGQDGNINDHHFHWGYFIHAAAFLEQYEPGWAAQWGEMIDLLVRDASTPNRDDALFPFLRNFSPYAGHCWANGFASFPQGNDQESTSESMQFHSSLIHWGAVTGNDSIRDLGIYLYTTEQAAVEEYWFDRHERIFGPNQQYSLVSRVWGNSYDNGTFWTSDIAASYGIELYPIHGGSLYLGHDSAYVAKLWNEIEANTGILNNEANPNLWHDIYWEYLSFIDPQKAIDLYNAYPERTLKFGVSDAQTYHWLHTMNVLGRVDTTRTANHPLAAAFRKGSDITYVGQNYTDNPIDVTFSDGFVLSIPARSMATNKDISLRGTLTSSFGEAYPGGSVDLMLTVSGGQADSVVFMDGETAVGTVLAAPYEAKASGLTAGIRSMYARIYEGENYSLSNILSVTVGEQLPYLGDPIALPGTFDAGHFDLFEGGIGQGISYNDLTTENIGGERPQEYVDVVNKAGEGATVGWIAAGEWMEYTVEVQQPGLYSFNFRYACGNNSGGGPLRIELDGETIRDNITVSYTGDWDTWSTRTITGIPLKSGHQVLRVYFDNGELNLGRLTFTYSDPLPYDQPVANAGDNVLALLPQTTADLNGSNSSDPSGTQLTYSWTQIYGPTVLTFSDATLAQPQVSGLEEGVYLIRLKVDNGSYQDEDDVYLISSTSANVAPKVSLVFPASNASYIEGEEVSLFASASDLIGEVVEVAFYADNQLIGTDTDAPYEWDWTPDVGTYELRAEATDDDGASTSSALKTITVEEAPSCRGTSFDGDFDWEWSDADNNPTITFIPSIAGMGSPTCILYYGTNPSSLGGWGVTPNVPFQINASEGETIYFYYTYSYPGQGEKNNSANMDSYLIGSCKSDAVGISQASWEVKLYPNPVTNLLQMDLPSGPSEIFIYDLTGRMIDAFSSQDQREVYDMSHFEAGMYLFRIRKDGETRTYKMMK